MRIFREYTGRKKRGKGEGEREKIESFSGETRSRSYGGIDVEVDREVKFSQYASILAQRGREICKTLIGSRARGRETKDRRRRARLVCTYEVVIIVLNLISRSN